MTTAQQNEKKELVVVLHGILDNAWKMKMVEGTLKKNGYDVLNISYPSTKHTIEELADWLDAQIKNDDLYRQAGKVHFVTHSMGGLVTRYYIHKFRPRALGRVVMLGTPNTGSEFADFLAGHDQLRPVFERICGPAGYQLRTSHVHDRKMKVDYELGVVAGSLSLNPLAPFVLPGESDGTVPVERTKIKGMKDHIVLPSTHVFMVYSPRVLKQVVHFLKHGKFEHPPAVLPPPPKGGAPKP